MDLIRHPVPLIDRLAKVFFYFSFSQLRCSPDVITIQQKIILFLAKKEIIIYRKRIIVYPFYQFRITYISCHFDPPHVDTDSPISVKPSLLYIVTFSA